MSVQFIFRSKLNIEWHSGPHSGDPNINKFMTIYLGRKTVFNCDLEEYLIKYYLAMEEKFYGLTAKDFKSFAFQLEDSETYSIQQRFNKFRTSADWKWLHWFMMRHPKLSLRKLHNTNEAYTDIYQRNTQKIFIYIMDKIN